MKKKKWNNWNTNNRKKKGTAAKWFPCIVFILSLSLGLLSGCGRESKDKIGSATMGRYIEQPLASVENIDQAM